MKSSTMVTIAAASVSTACVVGSGRRAISKKGRVLLSQMASTQFVQSLVIQPGEGVRYILSCSGRDKELRQLLAEDKLWQLPRTVELVQKFLDSEPGFNLRHDEIDELLEIVTAAEAIIGGEKLVVADIVRLCDGLPVNVVTLELRRDELTSRAG